VAPAKKLNHANPKAGKRMSLRKIGAPSGASRRLQSRTGQLASNESRFVSRFDGVFACALKKPLKHGLLLAGPDEIEPSTP